MFREVVSPHLQGILGSFIVGLQVAVREGPGVSDGRVRIGLEIRNVETGAAARPEIGRSTEHAGPGVLQRVFRVAREVVPGKVPEPAVEEPVEEVAARLQDQRAHPPFHKRPAQDRPCRPGSYDADIIRFGNIQGCCRRNDATRRHGFDCPLRSSNNDTYLFATTSMLYCSIILCRALLPILAHFSLLPSNQ